MKEIVSADGLTPDDYGHSGCDQSLSSSPRRWNSDYLMVLFQRWQEAEGKGEKQSAAVYRLLFAVVHNREPWNRQPEPSDDDPVLASYSLDAGAEDYLRQILTRIADDEVRARAADLLYRCSIGGRNRDFASAKIAVDSYISEAARREGPSGHWCDAEDRIERAFVIAVELNQRSLLDRVIGHIDQALLTFTAPTTANPVCETSGTADHKLPSRYPAQLMRLLLRYKEGNPDHCVELADRLSREAIATGQWDLGRDYLDITADWHGRIGDNTSRLNAQERCAEAWVQEGEHLVKLRDSTPMAHQLAAHRLLNGIHALREVKGRFKECGLVGNVDRLADRIDDVRRLHLQYEEQGIKALVQFRDSVAIDPARIYAIVDGKSKFEALFAMANFSVPTRSEIEKMVREEHDQFVFSRLFGLALLDARGRTTARSGAGTSDSDLLNRTFHRAVMLYALRAQLHVEPHRSRIVSAHSVDVWDFLLMARLSRFVPQGREMFFARGLHAGMYGDFALSLHLLIPQIEHCVRIILQAGSVRGIGSCESSKKVPVDELTPTLPEALCEGENVKILQGMLGEEVVFALRAILVERFGGNMRHIVLHGLTEYTGLQVWLSSYLWWLVLRICCVTATASDRSCEA